MRFLLDTDICIYLVKNRHARLLDKISHTAIGEIGISSITIAELQYGVQKSKQQHKNLLALTNYISPFGIVDFDVKAAIEYGIIRADLERKGKLIGHYDMLIAAVARSLELTVVTNNTREFKRVTELNVENWVH